MSYEEQIMSKDKYPLEHIFIPDGGYSVYYPSNLFHMRTVVKIGEYSQIFIFSLLIFGGHFQLKQLFHLHLLDMR